MEIILCRTVYIYGVGLVLDEIPLIRNQPVPSLEEHIVAVFPVVLDIHICVADDIRVIIHLFHLNTCTVYDIGAYRLACLLVIDNTVQSRIRSVVIVKSVQVAGCGKQPRR